MDQKVLKLDPAFNAELRRVIDCRDARCPRCGYDLSGLFGPRCPECGKNIREILRVADTTPWRLPHIRRRMIAAWIFRRLAVFLLAAGFAASVGWLVWSSFGSR